MKLLSLFSGIGAFEKALKNLGIKYDLVNYCEIDKYVSKAYSLIHQEPESKNLWDITKVNEKELPDFDLMTYGFPCQPFSVTGLRNGKEDRRGNLFFDAMRIADFKKPKYMIAENVPGLLSIDEGEYFKSILETLDSIGYYNYHRVINSKDYGFPQNRKRIFLVSIRKDVNDYDYYANNLFRFKNYKKIKLEELVDDCQCIIDDRFKSRKVREYYSYSPSITVSGSDEFKVKTNQNNIRRLTTLECFRLMGFTDQDHNKLSEISNIQKYKMAGNSIIVNILEEIFRCLFLINYL